MRSERNEWDEGAGNLRKLLSNPWIGLGLAWALGLALGYIGLYRYAIINGGSTQPFDLLYLLLQLVALESGALERPIPWELEIARFALPALATWTLVRTAMLVFREQAAQFSLRFWRDHVVLCGLGRKGTLLLSDLLADDQKVVVIEADEELERIDWARRLGAVVLTGNATDEEVLRRARVERARTLIAVLGDDGLNAEVAVRAESILCDFDRLPLHCLVHIVDADLWDMLRGWEFSGDCLVSLRLDLFNIYQRGAELMLGDYPVVDQTRNGPIGGSAYVIGLGSLGRHLIVQLAEQWFRARKQREEKVRVTIIDQHATKILDLLLARFPRIEDALDLEVQNLDVRSAEFLRGDYLRAQQPERDLKGVYICLDNDPLVLSTALTMKRQLSGVNTTIVMRMFEKNGLSRLVSSTSEQNREMPMLREFALVERTCTRELLASGTHERLARALHETYLRSHPEAVLPVWDQLSEEFRNSNRSQADHIARMLAENGFTVTLLMDWGEAPREFSSEEIETLACVEHERWRAEKVKQGWRHAKGVKDEAGRTHPDLVPWEQLPEKGREINRATIRALPTLLHEAGFSIRRSN